MALVKFEDIDTAERARELTGCEVFFPREKADSDEANISWAEIIGYTVVNSADGKAVGTISAVDDTTINVLLSVADSNGDEHLIPISEDLMAGMDKKERTITLNIPDGLLEL